MLTELEASMGLFPGFNQVDDGVVQVLYRVLLAPSGLDVGSTWFNADSIRVLYGMYERARI